MSTSKAQRQRQRALRREKRRQEVIPRRNEYGTLDLTPHNSTRPDGEVILK